MIGRLVHSAPVAALMIGLRSASSASGRREAATPLSVMRMLVSWSRAASAGGDSCLPLTRRVAGSAVPFGS